MFRNEKPGPCGPGLSVAIGFVAWKDIRSTEGAPRPLQLGPCSPAFQAAWRGSEGNTTTGLRLWVANLEPLIAEQLDDPGLQHVIGDAFVGRYADHVGGIASLRLQFGAVWVGTGGTAAVLGRWRLDVAIPLQRVQQLPYRIE